MYNSTNVLITGAGGHLAHFIFRAIQHSKLNTTIIGCNYDHDAVGLYQMDKGYVVPPAKSDNYIDKLIDICLKEKIHIIFAGGMIELRVLSKHKKEIFEKTGAKVISSDFDIIRNVEDKCVLPELLIKSGMPAPNTVLASDTSNMQQFLDVNEFPLMVKDRFGSGSQGIAKVNNLTDLQQQVKEINNPIIQEYLQPDDEEYTVGVYVTQDHQPVGSIVMKRTLGLGMTMKAEVVIDNEISDFCERAVATLGLVGPNNVQLRKTEKGPMIFEINPRLSSTTSARPLFGYNDIEMSIREYVYNEKLSKPIIKSGYFYRVIEDIVVQKTKIDTTEKNKYIDNTRP
jgi:carbamoyl-phosphate synthase large subunit